MANGNTLFISPEYIKAKTFIDANVDEKYLKVATYDVQQTKLKYIIGSGLFDEIENQLDANTLTALNTTLLYNYILPCLKHLVLVEALPFMLIKLTNKTVGTKNSENSNSSEYSIMNKMLTDAENNAQLMAKHLQDYLSENHESYPLYYNPGNGINIIHPQKNTFESGIFLGNSHNKNASYGTMQDNPRTYGCDE